MNLLFEKIKGDNYMWVLVDIPACSGYKGLKDKSIKLLYEKTLMVHMFEAVLVSAFL